MFCCQVKANTGPLMRGNILDMWELMMSHFKENSTLWAGWHPPSKLCSLSRSASYASLTVVDCHWGSQKPECAVANEWDGLTTQWELRVIRPTGGCLDCHAAALGNLGLHIWQLQPPLTDNVAKKTPTGWPYKLLGGNTTGVDRL